MLILARKVNQSIIIDGRIVVKVLRIERDTVKLGIQAPAEISVHRQEVFEAIQRAKQGPEGQPPTAPGQAQGPTAQPPPSSNSSDPAGSTSRRPATP